MAFNILTKTPETGAKSASGDEQNTNVRAGESRCFDTGRDCRDPAISSLASTDVCDISVHPLVRFRHKSRRCPGPKLHCAEPSLVRVASTDHPQQSAVRGK